VDGEPWIFEFPLADYYRNLKALTIQDSGP